MKRKIFIVSFLTLFLDQIIKIICNLFLDNIVVIKGVLSFIYAENNGVAFSMLSGNRLFIVILSIILIFILLYYIYKDYIVKGKNNNFKNFSYGILLGGILGNLFDRIIRGVVIDYISLNIFGYNFPIFNLADISITIGVILICFSYFMEIYNNKKEKC